MSTTEAVDLRSDTVTRPTPAMRRAMAEADVGDDVADFDPTTRRLEETIAAMLGKEAAIFVPSGTMSNQLALRVHCQPGDSFLCEAECHIVRYEQGAYAQLSGLAAQTVPGVRGMLTVEQLDDALPHDDDHCTRGRLVCLENTHNRAGGRVLPQESVVAVSDWAHQHGLAMHLDGARLFNAHVATGLSLETLAGPFDTVNVCFSKGLGAPVGSALAGPADLVAKARRARKAFGGAMRQCGIIAAGALHGLTEHLPRLAEDHRRAKTLAARLGGLEGLTCDSADVETNIVLFDVDPAIGTAETFCRACGAAGVLMYDFARQRVRAVTHGDLDDAAIDAAVERIGHVLADRRSLVAAPVA